MEDHPTPREAARALHDVDERKKQAIDSTRRPRWIDVVFGLAIFAMLASHDFLSEEAARYPVLIVDVLVVVYSLLLRTRRGAAILGQPTRVRRDGISRRFTACSIAVLVAAILIATLPPLLGVRVLIGVPYWHTIVGAVLGLVLIFLGRALQNGMNALAYGGNRGKRGALDGQF